MRARLLPLLLVLAAATAAAVVLGGGAPGQVEARPGVISAYGAEHSAARVGTAAQQVARPNVLVVMTDDQSLTDLRAMHRTQRLVGRQGTTFTNAAVSFPQCCPSRATFFTGQYAHNNGVFGNKAPRGGYARLRQRSYLPVWLQEAGYRTQHIGKFLNNYGRGAHPRPPKGWTDWQGSLDPSTYRYYDYTLLERGVPRTFGTAQDEASYQTDVYTQRAIDLISRSADLRKPFFLSLAYLAPHGGLPNTDDDPARLPTPDPAPRHRDAFADRPLQRGPAFDEADVSDKPGFIRARKPFTEAQEDAIRENDQQRLESLLSVDEGVERLVEALRVTGQLDNTLIIFTSDNGYIEGEHRVPNGKVLPYEESVRVPLLIRGPGVPKGVRRRQLVGNADLASTILEATGARARKPQDGISLFPLMRDAGLEPGREQLLEGLRRDGGTYAGLRNYRFTYVEHSNGERELYDRSIDPFQLESLDRDPEYAGVRRELARRLDRLRNCRGVTCLRGPRLRPALAASDTRVVRIRRGQRRRPALRRCLVPRIDLSLRGRDLDDVAVAAFRAGGRTLARDDEAPYAVRVPPTSRRRERLRIQAELSDGRRVTLQRSVRICQA